MADVLSLENGKYEVTFDAGNLSATRNGELWRDLTGDKLIYAMMCECMNAQQHRAELLESLQEVLPMLEQLLMIRGEPEPGSIGHKARAAIAKAIGA